MIRPLPFFAPLASMLFAMSPPPATSPLATSPLPRISPGALRVVTWNIGANSVVPAGFASRSTIAGDANTRAAAFGRVMRALDADVVCLQELTIGPERTAALFDAVHPLPDGKRWYAVSQLGNVLVSRYPLSERRGRTLRDGFSQRGHVIARVAMPGSHATDAPTVACMHLQAKDGAGNVAFRERHAAAVVRDLHGVQGPVIALGDLNAIDHPAAYVHTLMMGDGASTAFPLTAARATHNGAGTDAYTWRNDRSGFAPGVLDYILFTDRRFVARSAFVLNTMTLPDAERVASGLHAGDALRRDAEYDHLPVVVDLEPRT